MKLYGIGFLMDHLNIKTKQLSDYLHVDRSLVSKWRSGARKIDPNALYFNKMIDFFILLDQPNQLATLKLLFGLKDDDSEEAVTQTLKQFILNNKKPLLYDQYIANDHTYAYIASVPVYNDSTGNQAAILNFLDIASNQKPCKLTFVYDGILDLIRLDTRFHAIYSAKIISLLDNGFHLELLYSSHNAAAVSSGWGDLFFHKNCTFLEFQSDITAHKFSLYILENQLVLSKLFIQHVGYSHKDHPNQSDTISYLFSDPISIATYTKIADSIKLKSSALFHHVDLDIHTHPDQSHSCCILFDPEYSTPYFTASNLLYYKSVYPPFYLMNEATFLEVLEQSYSCEKMRQKILTFYHSWRNLFNRCLPDFYITHFYSLLFLNQVSKLDTIVLGYKDCVFSPEFTLTREQMRIFLNDIADLLLNNKGFNICLTPHTSSAHMAYKYDFYLSGKSLFVSTHESTPRYMYSTNKNYINSTMNILQQKFFYADKHLTDRIHVAETLRCLITD